MMDSECQNSGLRVIIPPMNAPKRLDIVCQFVKEDNLMKVPTPPLMDGEGLATQMIELGPIGTKFLGPVIIEVPHSAYLRDQEREITILRSDTGESWRNHSFEASKEAMQKILMEGLNEKDFKQLENLDSSQLIRILTTDLPHYFAIVTAIKQDVQTIGPGGGMILSTVVPQVQAVFPQGASLRDIKIGIQAQQIAPDLVAKLVGNNVAVSPIVTIEPRRRKFRQPILLTIPAPQFLEEKQNQHCIDSVNLRMLASITGGKDFAQWEDITGSAELTHANGCISFTSTVTAKFWLMNCSNVPETAQMANKIYREAIAIPYMAQFRVFSKRQKKDEAIITLVSMAINNRNKLLDVQENFIEVAKSPAVKLLEGKTNYLEFSGNFEPSIEHRQQLSFKFLPLLHNKLSFTLCLKNSYAEPAGEISIMSHPKDGCGDVSQAALCKLSFSLPDLDEQSSGSTLDKFVFLSMKD